MKISVSSICSGISPEQAVEFVQELRTRLGDTEVGLELMPTKSTPIESFLSFALSRGVNIHSLHGPFLLRSTRTLTERVEAAFWRPIQGEVSFDDDGLPHLNNPAFEMSEKWKLPIIIHGPVALELVHLKAERARAILGSSSIRVENGKENLPLAVRAMYTPFELAVEFAALLKGLEFNVEGICLDVGHLAVDAYQHGWQGGSRSFMEKAVLPAQRQAAAAGLAITELHLHDFDIRCRLDHLALGEGCLPFEAILKHFLAHNPELQLTLELVPNAPRYLALSYLRWGYDEILRRVESSVRYLRSIAYERASA